MCHQAVGHTWPPSRTCSHLREAPAAPDEAHPRRSCLGIQTSRALPTAQTESTGQLVAPWIDRDGRTEPFLRRPVSTPSRICLRTAAAWPWPRPRAAAPVCRSTSRAEQSTPPDCFSRRRRIRSIPGRFRGLREGAQVRRFQTLTSIPATVIEEQELVCRSSLIEGHAPLLLLMSHFRCGASPPRPRRRASFRARARLRRRRTSRTNGVSERSARRCHAVPLFPETALSVSRRPG